ncbi:AMP-binding protein [Thalassotalea litorea]|uniref:AMP-binding protein n=1 Tax=Thalassotalea litorea TaxID=2020715 RepID=UPI0037353302
MSTLRSQLRFQQTNNLFEFDSKRISSYEFFADIASYRAKVRKGFQNVESESPAVLLSEDDVYLFAVRLFAIANEGGTLVFPANSQSQTLAELAASVDFCAGSVDVPDLQSLEDIHEQSSVDESIYWPLYGRLIFFTSGSSGQPKKIEKQWANLNSELVNLSQTFAIPSETVFLSSVSHQHIYGMLFRLLWPIANGVTVTKTIAYPEHARELIEKHSQICFVSSPAFLKRLALDNIFTPYHHKFSEIFSSGGPLADATATLLAQQFKRGVRQIYGSTESGGIAHRTFEQLPAPDWTLFPGIVIETDKGSGQIRLSSPYIQETSLLMDDIGVVTSGNRLKLRGRVDRTIKLEEKRVNLTQMEQYLRTHPDVNNCKMIALAQERQIIATVVEYNGKVDTANKRAAQNRLKQFLEQKFERVCLPRKWRFVEQFPYNSQGKVPLRELEKLFDGK